MLPLRSGPSFAATSSVTVTAPVREAAPITLTQPASDTAVQPHAAWVSTRTLTRSPLAVTAWSVGDTLKRHGAASCATDTSASFTLTAARRTVGSAFGATRKPTCALPWPERGPVISIHAAVLTTSHVQSRVVAT